MAIIVGAFVTLAGASSAPAADGSHRSPEDLVVEGVDKMKQALEEMLRALPRFEAPIITEDGDIIIRRAPPLPPPAPEWPPEREQEPFGGIET